MRVTLADGTHVECADEALGEGASGAVYLTNDGAHVVKIFKTPTVELAEAMEKILGEYNCVVNDSYWRTLFCWPDGLAVKPSLGIRMPAIPSQFRQLVSLILSKSYERLSPADRSWHSRMLIALRLSRAVARLHRTGLAHSDLSPNNIFVQPTTGEVRLIDMDGLVVKGFLPPQVIGTPEYIAPEILDGTGIPSPQADNHALAVLIYQLLLYRHPLRGPRRYAEDAEEDERRALSSEGVYVDHPTDRSNRPARGFWPARLLGASMAALFERAFVVGLKSPANRPTAGDWETAIARMSDRVVTCGNSSCAEKYFPATDGVPLSCPWCRSPLDARGIPLLRLYRQDHHGTFQPEPDWWIAGLPGRTLHRWHVELGIEPGPKVDNAPVARVEVDRSGWHLRNLGVSRMRLVTDGKVADVVELGQARPLIDGGVFLLAPPPTGRAIVIQSIKVP